MNKEWEIFPKCNGGTWDGKNHMGEKVRRRKKRRKKKVCNHVGKMEMEMVICEC